LCIRRLVRRRSSLSQNGLSQKNRRVDPRFCWQIEYLQYVCNPADLLDNEGPLRVPNERLKIVGQLSGIFHPALSNHVDHSHFGRWPPPTQPARTPRPASRKPPPRCPPDSRAPARVPSLPPPFTPRAGPFLRSRSRLMPASSSTRSSVPTWTPLKGSAPPF